MRGRTGWLAGPWFREWSVPLMKTGSEDDEVEKEEGVQNSHVCCTGAWMVVVVVVVMLVSLLVLVAVEPPGWSRERTKSRAGYRWNCCRCQWATVPHTTRMRRRRLRGWRSRLPKTLCELSRHSQCLSSLYRGGKYLPLVCSVRKSGGSSISCLSGRSGCSFWDLSMPTTVAMEAKRERDA